MKTLKATNRRLHDDLIQARAQLALQSSTVAAASPYARQSAGAGFCGDMIIAQLEGEIAQLKRELKKQETERVEKENAVARLRSEIEDIKDHNTLMKSNFEVMKVSLERHAEHVRVCPYLVNGDDKENFCDGLPDENTTITEVNRIASDKPCVQQ